MSNIGLLEVQKKISEIESAIRERDVNRGISAYNTLRLYVSDPSIDFQAKKFAHEKGIELHAILIQMRQEILQNEAIQATNARTQEQQEQSAYADPMPLRSAKDTSKPSINFKTIIIIVLIFGLIGGGTYLFMTGSTAGGCSVDGPFACKETSLKVSADNMAQNFIILKMDQSKGVITQINITNTSQSLKNCNNIYIDKAYSLATNYQELKIMLDCKNITLSNVAADITLSYKLNGEEKTSTVKLSTLQSAINEEIKPKETPQANATNITTHNTSTNVTSNNNSNRNNTTNTTGGDNNDNINSYTGGGGGGGGSGGDSSISIDHVSPTVTLGSPSPTSTLNSDGSTFNITFTAQGYAHGIKVLNNILLTVYGSTTTCTANVYGLHTAICTYVYNCSKSLMGTNITYLASATDLDTGTESDDISNTYIIPDFILPAVSISTSNTSSLTSTPTTIIGSASDNYNLSYIQFRVNNGTWHNASGTSSWSINANVRNGTNYVEVRATDSFSNVNSTIKTFTATLRPEFMMPIYSDAGLDADWIDTSYNSIINLSDDSVSYNGSPSISFNGNTAGALSLTKANATINNIDGYNNLSFYINGTTNTSIIVRARGDADDSVFPDISLSNFNINMSNLTGDWEYVEINMTQLNPNKYPINRIEFKPTMLPDGANDTMLYIYALGLSGRISDVSAPQLMIEYPQNNSVVNMPLTIGNRNITIKGNVTDDTYIDEVLVNVNGTMYNMTITNYFTLTPNITHNWSGIITLNNDTNLINVTAYDTFGRGSGIYSWNVTLNWTPDITPPSITINSGVVNNRTNQTIVKINGTSMDDVNGTGLNLTVWRMNFGPWHNISSSTTWMQTVLLTNNTNFVEAMAIDNSGNNATKNVTIYYNYTNMGAIPLMIYNDNLTFNWSYDNASIGQNVSVNSTDQVYCGNTSFRTDSNASGTLNIMLGNTTDGGINSMNYTRVRFAIYSNQTINLYVQLGFLNNTNSLYYNSSNFTVPQATWYIINESVNTLMAGNTTFNSLGLTINETSNVTYYLDNVQIVP